MLPRYSLVGLQTRALAYSWYLEHRSEFIVFFGLFPLPMLVMFLVTVHSMINQGELVVKKMLHDTRGYCILCP